MKLQCEICGETMDIEIEMTEPKPKNVCAIPKVYHLACIKPDSCWLEKD